MSFATQGIINFCNKVEDFEFVQNHRGKLIADGAIVLTISLVVGLILGGVIHLGIPIGVGTLGNNVMWGIIGIIGICALIDIAFVIKHLTKKPAPSDENAHNQNNQHNRIIPGEPVPTPLLTPKSTVSNVSNCIVPMPDITGHFASLPSEINLMVLSSLPPAALNCMNLTCKFFNVLINDNEHLMSAVQHNSLTTRISVMLSSKPSTELLDKNVMLGDMQIFCLTNELTVSVHKYAYQIKLFNRTMKKRQESHLSSEIVFDNENYLFFTTFKQSGAKRGTYIYRVDKRKGIITHTHLESSIMPVTQPVVLFKKDDPQAQNAFENFVFVHNPVTRDFGGIIGTSFVTPSSFYSITRYGLVTLWEIKDDQFTDVQHFSIPIQYPLHNDGEAIVSKSILTVRERDINDNYTFYAYNLQTAQGKKIQPNETQEQKMLWAGGVIWTGGAGGIKHGVSERHVLEMREEQMFCRDSDYNVLSFTLTEKEDHFSAQTLGFITNMVHDSNFARADKLCTNKKWIVAESTTNVVHVFKKNGELFDEFNVNKYPNIQLFANFILVYASSQVFIRDIPNKKNMVLTHPIRGKIEYAELNSKGLKICVDCEGELKIYNFKNDIVQRV